MGEVRLHRPVRDVHPVADLGIRHAFGHQAGDGALGRGEAVPAELRPAAAAPAAPADARPAQHRLGPGQVAGGAEPLVDLGRPVEQLPGLAGQAAPGQRRPGLLGGERQLERPRSGGEGVDRGAQRARVVVQQAAAAQRRRGQRADAGILLGELGEAGRHRPRPSLVRAGQGQAHQVGADHPVLQHQA